MSSVRPGFYVGMGEDDRLVVKEDGLGMPGFKRYRTRKHADGICAAWNKDAASADVARRFGAEEVA